MTFFIYLLIYFKSIYKKKFHYFKIYIYLNCFNYIYAIKIRYNHNNKKNKQTWFNNKKNN